MSPAKAGNSVLGRVLSCRNSSMSRSRQGLTACYAAGHGHLIVGINDFAWLLHILTYGAHGPVRHILLESSTSMLPASSTPAQASPT